MNRAPPGLAERAVSPYIFARPATGTARLMDISGSRRILAPRDAVWAALNDPDVLAVCIPGCERVEKVGDGAYEGAVAAKIGPLRTVFEGRLTVTGAKAPERCALAATAADPAAGSGEGRGEITLAEDGDETVVSYRGTFEVDGKVGQLGSRLLSGFVRQAIEGFFVKVADLVAEGAEFGRDDEDRAADAPLAEAPPLVHEEPGLGPAPVLDAPPLAGGARMRPQEPHPIAPTGVPDTPDPAAITAAGAAEGGGSVIRIMLVAAIVIAVGIAAWAYLQPPV